jgi:hypothetical protein
LGEVAAFLRLFAKTVTVYPSPIDGTCMDNVPQLQLLNKTFFG